MEWGEGGGAGGIWDTYQEMNDTEYLFIGCSIIFYMYNAFGRIYTSNMFAIRNIPLKRLNSCQT